MDVWIVDAINLKSKKGSTVGVVFDKAIAEMISQHSNEKVIYAYHHESIYGRLFACDKDSWVGRQVEKGGT